MAAPAQARVPDGFIGVTSEDSLGGTGSYRAHQMKAMKAMGVTLLRQTIDWSVVERKRGKYDFRFYDNFFGTAAKYGIRVMPILFNAPTFRSKQAEEERAARHVPAEEQRGLRAVCASRRQALRAQGQLLARALASARTGPC